MITRLRIKNFKSLGDTGNLAIRPLTLLVGPNSGGKTSILQSLLLLRQTVDSRDIAVPLVVNGEYVRLGSYSDFVFMQDRRRRLMIEFEFSPRRDLFRVGGGPSAWVSGTRIETANVRVTTEFGYNTKTMQIFVQATSFIVGDLGLDIRRSNGKYKLSLKLPGVAQDSEAAAAYKFYDVALLPTKTGPSSEMRFVSRELASAIEALFGNLYYLGPLRERPLRSYVATGVAPQDVGLKGELFVDVLWAQTKRKAVMEPLMGKVNLWMKHFGLASELRLRRIGRTNNYSLDLLDPHTNLSISLADVGFGASEVLPVIVEGFYAPAKAILLIEQPEIHLHPRAQAMLGDLFIDIAKTGAGKTLLIETHSEHLIARIQRRIAERKLDRSDVAVYYCQPSAGGTQITEIKLNDLGQFEAEGLPEGFFEEGYRESLDHFKAMAHASSAG